MVGHAYQKFHINGVVIKYNCDIADGGYNATVGDAWIVINLQNIADVADKLYNDPHWDSEACYKANKREYVCFNRKGDDRRRYISRYEALIQHMTSGPIKKICHPSYLAEDGFAGYGWTDHKGVSHPYERGVKRKHRKDKEDLVGHTWLSRHTAAEMFNRQEYILLDCLGYMKYPVWDPDEEEEWDY